MGEAKYQRRRAEADRLLQFSLEIAEYQRRQNLWFLLEHPDGAASWETDAVRRLCGGAGVIVSRFDQCRFGLRCPGTGEPIRKRTRFVHNLPEIDRVFGHAFCTCSTNHRQIQGSEAGVQLSSHCESYPPDMVTAMLSAIRAEISVEMLD